MYPWPLAGLPKDGMASPARRARQGGKKSWPQKERRSSTRSEGFRSYCHPHTDSSLPRAASSVDNCVRPNDEECGHQENHDHVERVQQPFTHFRSPSVGDHGSEHHPKTVAKDRDWQNQQNQKKTYPPTSFGQITISKGKCGQ